MKFLIDMLLWYDGGSFVDIMLERDWFHALTMVTQRKWKPEGCAVDLNQLICFEYKQVADG